jgi:hypothetical protein
MTELVNKLFQELTYDNPEDVIIDTRPNNIMDVIEKQGEDIFNSFWKAKRKKNRKQMLLFMYYLGELFEEIAPIQRNLNRHSYLNSYYLQVALKTYRLFEDVGPEQIYRTKETTITHIHRIKVDNIDEVKELIIMFNNFQPEVEIQGRESVTLENQS